MSSRVAIIGGGALARLAVKAVSEHCEVYGQEGFTAELPETIQLAIVLCDEWNESFYLKAEDELRRIGMPWLCSFVSYGECVVGPFVRPGTPGCSQCAAHRRRDTEEMMERQVNRLLASEDEACNSSTSPAGLWQAVHLLANEMNRILQGDKANTEEHVYIINLKTLEISLHFFLPDSLCPVCAVLPDDSPLAAQITLMPQPKANANSSRSRSIDELKHFLARDYLDSRTGLYNEKWHHLTSHFSNTSVNMPSFLWNEIAGGRAHSYMESELIAMLEGLERSCGFSPRGKRTVIHDSYRNLAEEALDPLKVGVYSQEQYALSDFPYETFDPDHPIGWVWGYSFLRERPVLVPETLAYYSWDFGGGFVQETSNGCALGGSIAEAILHGILEVAERDSFLLTWYAQLPVPRLDPFSANDQELSLMVERLRAVAGCDVHLFNTTLESGIPSIWAIATNKRKVGANLVCAAGAHLDPVKAARNAIHELSNSMLILQANDEEGRERAGSLYEDSSLVRQMSDHSLLYSLPQAGERLQFLLDERRPLCSFGEQFVKKESHADLTDDLKDVLRVFRELNLDVIAVDQTSPEASRNGLYCVKVLIPGMLPMTFGHHLIRLTGLQRVLTVPAALGYAKQPLAAEQLNPHPHPFP